MIFDLDPKETMRLQGPVLLLLLAALVAGCGDGKKAELPSASAGRVVKEPQDAAKAPAEATSVDGVFSGTLEARRRSTLSPRVSGVVTKVFVRDGDAVAEGSALVTLDLEDFSLRSRLADAALLAAKAQLSAAEADWKRGKALLADAAMPPAQFEATNARYLGAKAGVAQAEVGLAMARKAERDATVRAPYGGVVVHRQISEGEYASVMPATQLLTIEETGTLDLRLYVPADLAAGIRAGDPLKVHLAAFDRDVAARVTQVVPPLDPKSGSTALLVEVVDPEHTLRPGMTAEAKVVARPGLQKVTK